MTEKTAKKKSATRPRKRTARFDITFTVEVEVTEPRRKGWQVSDAAIDVEQAATALVDSAPSRPFRHSGVTITDTLGFGATFIEEVDS
jgi:hypothetical protein